MPDPERLLTIYPSKPLKPVQVSPSGRCSRYMPSPRGGGGRFVALSFAGRHVSNAAATLLSCAPPSSLPSLSLTAFRTCLCLTRVACL